MNDITKHCDENVGGIFNIKFSITTDVVSIVEPVNSSILEPVTLKPSGRWYELYATEGTIKFEEEQIESAHGDYFKVKISGSTPKDRKEIIDVLNLIKDLNFIIDYTDNNGLRKLVGNTQYPLKFKHTANTGIIAPNKNGYAWEFFGDIIKKSPEYNV